MGKLSAFQNDESKFHEWAKHEDCLIVIEPHLLAWALENDRNQTEHDCGQVLERKRDTQVVVQLSTVLAHLAEGDSWSIVQNCERNSRVERSTQAFSPVHWW